MCCWENKQKQELFSHLLVYKIQQLLHSLKVSLMKNFH